MAWFKRVSEKPDDFQSQLIDQWVLLEADKASIKWLIRARKSLPGVSFREKHKFLMLLRWDFSIEDHNYPLDNSNTHKRIMEFEDVLFSNTDSETWAIEAASITGEGIKEWRFFTANQALFLERFNQIFGVRNRYPLQIESFEDPEWIALSELLNASDD